MKKQRSIPRIEVDTEGLNVSHPSSKPNSTIGLADRSYPLTEKDTHATYCKILKYHLSMHRFIVTIVNYTYMFWLYKVAIFRLYISEV